MHEMIEVPTDDGERLAVDLFLPDAAMDGGLATLVEALPYRKDDVTESYAATYERFAAEGFAVVRVDLRGTGSSTGVATDEYPEIERTDLRTVIRWITAQPWSSGRVGLFGTSYSGFNAMQLAAEVERLQIPELGAVVAAYATDDRYTDDVHYAGGVLRALDLIDYPLYMVAMNALPPVPAVFGADWRNEWRRRLDETPAWLVEWLEHPVDAPTWRRGSVRLGPDGRGYERIGCPVMLVVGWADGYRNHSFRVIEQLERNGVPWRMVAGPWTHRAPTLARPGPNIDGATEILAFFDRHLRGGTGGGGGGGGDGGAVAAGQVYVREPAIPEPDLEHHPGRWVDIDAWPHAGLRHIELHPDPDRHPAPAIVETTGDVGFSAWNSCGGALPWGQPLDQRVDNARSWCVDWPIEEPMDVVGNATVRLRVASDRSFGHVSVKLCDVAPDGSSTLITRGMIDLRHRGCWPADPAGAVGAEPSDLTPGDWIDIAIPFEATTWRLVPGHVLRLAVAGTDWPNCWPPPGRVVLTCDPAGLSVELPVVDGLAPSEHDFVAGRGPVEEAEGVEWRFEHDVLARKSRTISRYGGSYEGRHGAVVTDDYRGEVGVSTADPAVAWARGSSSFEITWPDTTVRTEATLAVDSDAESLRVHIELRAWDGDALVAERTWDTTLPR